ncbi:MAG: N-acetyltransferase [Caulobacteraceae bacterium]|nr:N-acetyltransferase [Caulobacter sp.]
MYADAVLHGVGTFEETPPPPAEMERRRAEVIGYGLPHLVACEPAGEVLGFAYAGPFRTRTGYRWTAETTVYVDPTAKGRGVGSALLGEVVARCEALGLRRLIAIVGGAENAGSLALHGRHGFTRTGVVEAAGVKFGRWIDIVILARDLNGGAADMPTTPGLPFPR